jgi:hypothetical protein
MMRAASLALAPALFALALGAAAPPPAHAAPTQVGPGYDIEMSRMLPMRKSDNIGLQVSRDGHDAVEWIASQPWSDGHVFMYGGSFVGMTQLDLIVQSDAPDFDLWAQVQMVAPDGSAVTLGRISAARAFVTDISSRSC